MDKIDLFKRNLKTKFLENYPLSEFTTLKIGGPAKLVVEAKDEKTLMQVVRDLGKLKINFFLLGGGSNLLISDEGFDGVVILNRFKEIKLGKSFVYVSSGFPLQEFIDFLIRKGLSGMESLSGIPGTIGGAIYGNAGAYGQEIKDHMVKVKIFDGKRVKWLSKQDCKFGYRESIFKKTRHAILGARFVFKDKDSRKNLEKKRNEIIKVRSEKYPAGLKCPGSFFKNIIASKLSNNVLKKIPEDKIVFGKIPAGYLLEEVGAKGAKWGNIKVADYHANLFVNTGGGTARDFYSLAMKYRSEVKERLGIELIPEVQLIGF